jgi:hypothetical protein
MQIVHLVKLAVQIWNQVTLALFPDNMLNRLEAQPSHRAIRFPERSKQGLAIGISSFPKPASSRSFLCSRSNHRDR